MNGDELADAIAAPDVGFSALALILQILTRDAHGGIGKEGVVFSDPGWAFTIDVRHEARAGLDMHFGTDDAERADVGLGMNAGLGIYDRGSMDGHLLRGSLV